MRIVALSDTHNYLPSIDSMPEADVLIHAGDACTKGTLTEAVRFIDWLKKLSSKYYKIIYVPGNHDRRFDGGANEEQMHDLFNSIPNAAILTDSAMTFRGVRFVGSSVTPPIRSPESWHYYLNETDRKKHWDLRAYNDRDVDVLITHGPAYRIADRVNNDWHRWPHVGCKHLRQFIEETDPLLHIFGHIHETYGVWEANKFDVKKLNGELVRTLFVNAAIRDEHYNIKNPPIAIELAKVEGSWCLVSTKKIETN